MVGGQCRLNPELQRCGHFAPKQVGCTMQNSLPLDLLVCPQSHTPLQPAEALLVERMNRAIAAGNLVNASGRRVQKPIDAGLIRADGRVLYPIVDEIPILLAEEAIAVDQHGLAETK